MGLNSCRAQGSTDDQVVEITCPGRAIGTYIIKTTGKLYFIIKYCNNKVKVTNIGHKNLLNQYWPQT